MEQSAMSLLDLLYLEETKSDAVIAAARQWCAENGCEIGSENGKRAVAVAVRLAKAADDGRLDLFRSLSAQMTDIADKSSPGLILLVEDELLIAIDLEHTVQDAGFTVKICTSCADGLDWLADHSPSAAVLDLRLRDGSCVEVAALFEHRAIPFVVCSRSSRGDEDVIFSRAEWLDKPCDPEALIRAIKNAVAQGARQSEMEVNP
jgi:CheY-like chemotaxis protein